MATKAVPDILRRDWAGKLVWPVAALAAVLLYNLLFTPEFFSLKWVDGHLYGRLIDILRDGSNVMLLSLGMTLVIATGGVDLSVGAVMAMAGALAGVMIDRADTPLAWVLLAALALCALAGLWNGLLVAVFRVQPLVATLVLMVAGRGLAMAIAGGKMLTIRTGYVAFSEFSFIGQGFLFYVPLAVTIVVVMLLVTVVLTRKTAAGMFIEAVGDNEVASRYAGVGQRNVKFMVYAFSGLCAGVAGLLSASKIGRVNCYNAGLYLELDAIMAVVIGGTALTGGRFYLLGSIVGALLIQTLTITMMAHKVTTVEALVPKALVVVAVCLLQSAQFRRKVGRLVLAAGRRRRGRPAA